MRFQAQPCRGIGFAPLRMGQLGENLEQLIARGMVHRRHAALTGLEAFAPRAIGADDLMRIKHQMHVIHRTGPEAGDALLPDHMQRRRQHLAHLRQAREHGRDGDELGLGVARQQQGQRGLAAAGRAPEDHRVHVAGFHRAAQRAARRQQAALADHLVQGGRAHALGQGLEALGRLEQGVAGGFLAGHARILIRRVTRRGE